MSNEKNTAGEAEKVKKSIWGWTALGVFCGWYLGSVLAGLLWGAGVTEGPMPIGWTTAPILGFITYNSSKNNGGKAPRWLWRGRDKTKQEG